jgi:transposase
VRLTLNAEQRAELQRRVRAGTSCQRDGLRARIILACEDGGCAAAVARRVGVHPRTVERWRDRFRRQALPGLHDKPRPGAPPKFAPVARLELIALACEPVARHEGKTTRTIAELVDEAVARRLVDGIGWSSYQRLLAASELRPHRIQGWLHSPDPQFREKVTAITELYLHPPAGAVVLSIDEKTGMQALERRFPDRPAGGADGSSSTGGTGRNRSSARLRYTGAASWASAGPRARRTISCSSWSRSRPSIPRRPCTSSGTI